MYQNSTVGVVVPAYNEEGFVGEVIRGLPESVDRVYAIDDASTDDTWQEILDTAEAVTHGTQRGSDQHHTESSPAETVFDADSVASASVSNRRLLERRTGELRCIGDFVMIHHRENFGAGGAIKTGYLAALEDGVDIVVTIDADGQMDPTIMERLIDPLVEGTAEYAKGTRLVNDEYRQEMPLIRTVGNLALTNMTKVASGYWGMTDSQNGYTAITRSALRQIDVEDLFEYYAYCNAVLVRLNVHDIPIADVEVPTRYGDETSDIDYGEFIAKVTPMLYWKFLWRLWRKYVVRQTRPALVGRARSVGVLLVTTVFTLAARLLAPFRGNRERLPVHPAIFTLFFGVVLVFVMVLYERSKSAELVTIIPAGSGEHPSS